MFMTSSCHLSNFILLHSPLKKTGNKNASESFACYLDNINRSNSVGITIVSSGRRRLNKFLSDSSVSQVALYNA